MKGLYEALLEYQNENYYPMHMPGHKRNTSLLLMDNPYGIDITEIEGFDNLHDAQGILKDSMERAARVYGSEETHFLINGSTVGILCAMAASTKKGDKVLMARNCHKAVFNGVFLNELKPVYLYPQKEPLFGINGGISAENVREMLITQPDIKLIIITSPTYEGMVSDIQEIASIAHEKGIPLMVDEAHGAHLGFHPYFPKNAISMGADLVIHSVHKTLPAFTQTALLHVNGSLVNRERIKEYLSIYQTSSPSYLLMAGIDRCMELLEKKGKELFEDYAMKLQQFYEQMKSLEKLRVINKEVVLKSADSIFDVDPSKIVISSKHTSMTGTELYELLLEHYKIQVELVSTDYVIAMTSIGDTKEGFERLKNALWEIDGEIAFSQSGENLPVENLRLDMVLSPCEAYNKEEETILFSQSEGCISKEYAYLYPPGIPILVPGEMITKECLGLLQHYREYKLTIKGLKEMDHIHVVSR